MMPTSTLSPTVSLPTLSLCFNLPLRPDRVYDWRGAVAASAGHQLEEFHNHVTTEQEVYHYRYPLIHYRSQGGRASIWACGDGVELVHNWLRDTNLNAFTMNKHRRSLRVDCIVEKPFHLQPTTTHRHYRLLDWLALNQDNYKRWRKLETLHERIDLLQDILTGQLLGFATAAGWRLPTDFKAELVNLSKMRAETVKGTKRIAFNVIYRAPVLLPPDLALGRSVAFGFGVQRPLGGPLI